MSTPHNRAKKGEIAERILLPGDPLRAKYIAETYFDGPVLFNDVRGILGYTGTYKGVPISAMGTGMGIPSISIYANELIEQYGVKTLIRVGTCGGAQKGMKLGEVIMGMGCATDSGILRHVFPGDYAPIADFELLNTAYDKALAAGIKPYVGLMKSSDMFYFEPAPGDDYWYKYGVLGCEMEGAALYTIAAKFRVRALTMATISDTFFDEQVMSSEDREKSLNDMLKIALETAVEF